MLIKCSECHKEFSDKAQCCPNCGCPINQMDFSNYCIINGISYDLSDIMELVLKVGDKPTDVHPIVIPSTIHRKTQLDLNSSKQLADILIQTKTVPNQFDGKIEINNENTKTSNILKCPTCSSTNIQKIGTGERAVSVAMLGMFSKKINKSFKCKNCGYTW